MMKLASNSKLTQSSSQVIRTWFFFLRKDPNNMFLTKKKEDGVVKSFFAFITNESVNGTI